MNATPAAPAAPAASVAHKSPAKVDLPPKNPLVLPHSRPIIITIDGPAGTGKSSVARTLAKHLGLDFLDTGAMYRAAAAIVIDHQIDPNDVDAIVAQVHSADLHFDWKTDPPTIMAWDKPIAARIRDADVTAIVSPIAGIAELRRLMVGEQRLIAHDHPRLVTEGRDQGTVVFPDAAVKFYLDATPEVRATRRADQLKAAGRTADFAELLRDIIARDQSDSTRSDGPLRAPPDAIRIDTSAMTFEQVVETLEREVWARASK
ncbi:MAG: (d)CMP kinase [Phycisphaerales bacterium]|nr:(d)CMP kinase [Phycisphaerales bacterium]